MAKIAHITTVPGFLTFFTGQAEYMRKAGYETHFISSPGEQLSRIGKQEGAVVHAIPIAREMSPVADSVSLFRIVKLLRGLRPEIVHAHTPKAILLGMLGAKLAGTPVRINHLHGLRYTTLTGWRWKLMTTCDRLACTAATQVLSVSHSVRKQAIADGLAAAENIKVLGEGSINGIDAMGKFNPSKFSATERTKLRRQLGLPDDAVVLGFVGRLVRDKGICELAEAFELLKNHYPRLHLVLVGEHEQGDPVPAGTKSLLQNNERIHELGWRQDLPQLYACMDVLCLPSYREGLPYVPLEAASMRLPVVATRVNGCIDALVENVTGTLVEPRCCDSLAKAIKKYVENPQLRAQHGEAGRNRMLQSFIPEVVWQATLAEYDRLLTAMGIPLPARRQAPKKHAA